MRLMRGLPILLLVLSCATSEDSPQTGGVLVASTFGEVANCESLGPVQSKATGADDAIEDMRRQTLAKGGNVLYVNAVGVTKTGVAYRCF